MDLSKLKIELYDFLGLLIPGISLMALICFAVVGWKELFALVHGLNGPTITAILFAGFAFGHFVQECSDWAIKKITNKRFFKQWRDELWASPEGDTLRRALHADGAGDLDVDAAFDFCLTKSQSVFAKREGFIATSDFCRAMVTIGIFSVIPLGRAIYDISTATSTRAFGAVCGVLAISLWCTAFWRRMLRFRRLSEEPVFRAYLSQRQDVIAKGGAA